MTVRTGVTSPQSFHLGDYFANSLSTLVHNQSIVSRRWRAVADGLLQSRRTVQILPDSRTHPLVN